MPKPKVEMVKIKNSSQIEAIGYKDGFLYVRFLKGGLYKYQNVPQSIYESLLACNDVNNETRLNKVSIGSLFHDLIKRHADSYPFKKIKE